MILTYSPSLKGRGYEATGKKKMKTLITAAELELFLEHYFFNELDAGCRSDETRLYQHIQGKIDLLPEIQSTYKFDEAKTKDLIHHAHEQTR